MSGPAQARAPPVRRGRGPPRFGLMAHPGIPDRLRVAEEVVRLLEGRAEVTVTDELAERFPKLPAKPVGAIEAEALITVGGDGAILLAMQKCGLPVFGVNMGELGFLTEVMPSELKPAMDRLVAGDYELDERLKLAVRVNGKAVPDATNEAVIKSIHPAKLLALSIRVAGGELDHLRADGIIVATPTGTTSYALSAGGPIVDPHISAMIMVPLAPFKLGARPFVFPSTADLSIALPETAKDAAVVVDGQYELPLSGGDTISFTGSEDRARFVRFGHSFYGQLRSRLMR